MQNNVNAGAKNAPQENPNAVNVLNMVVNNFGEGQVSTCDAGIIKLQIKALGNGDILTLSNALQWADVQVRRSDKVLLILFIPKANTGNYPEEVVTALETIQADIIE